MSLRYAVVLASGAALLAGCQAQEQEEATQPEGVAYETLEERFVETGCEEESCAVVEVKALSFPDSPTLDEWLRSRLLSMGAGITDGSERSVDSWEAYAERFFAQARENRDAAPQHAGSQALLGAQVHAEHDDLLIIELTGYVYHAGQAHGMPLTEFMVVDERLGRVVTLDDMLLDGQEAAFQEALARAHQRWLEQMDADDDFATSWPLSESDNVAPLEADWVVKYNVYDIAPYAVGQPELYIPHDELEGIAEPRYLGR